jgi:hypothetical protein
MANENDREPAPPPPPPANQNSGTQIREGGPKPQAEQRIERKDD